MRIKEDHLVKPTVLEKALQAGVSEGGLAARVGREVDLRFEPADDRFVWVTDAGTRVGLIDKKEATLEWVAPHPGKAPPRPAEIPDPYHAPSYQGGRLILQWWVNPSGDGFRTVGGTIWRTPPELGKPTKNADANDHLPKCKPNMDWAFSESGGREISFRINDTYSHDENIRGYHDVRLYYDPLPDSFVAEVKAELESPDPYITEYANFYAGGVYDNRPERKRHRCTVWANPDGRIIRWAHNPVGYMTPGMNDPDERSVADGGFIGYFSDPYTNPVVEVIQTNPPTACATCCNIYDEHLVHHMQKEQKTGPYRWTAHFRLLSLSMDAADGLIRQSSPVRYGVDPSHPNPVLNEADRDDNDMHCHIVYNPLLPGFYYGRVSDFEDPIPYDQTVAASGIFVSQSPEHEIYWDPSRGHSGTRSIRLRGKGNDELVQARISAGPTPHLYGGKQYRLSGWILCEGVTGKGARYRFDEIGFRPQAGGIQHIAGPAAGDHDWTYFEDLFTTQPKTEFGWLYLELEGSGQAWFDDVALEEV